MDRHEFFTKLAQYSILGGLLSIGGISLFRNITQDGSCQKESFCGRCKELDECELDKAKEYRENEKP